MYVREGEFLGIIGHTGSGKSTLIQHFNGLLKPTSGEILVDGINIWNDKKERQKVRFKVGLCFQYPEYQLFEETVEKDIAFGPKNMKLDDEQVNKRVHRAAEFAGVRKELLKKSPFDLSGGEKRRVAIAGIMAMEPKVLVLDEPTAGLDPAGRKDILEMISNYRRQTGSTVILVSHSMEDIAKYAERAIVINNSGIAIQGSIDEIFSNVAQLRDMGLDVPQITQVFLKLREKGVEIPTDIYTVEKAEKEILRLLRN